MDQLSFARAQIHCALLRFSTVPKFALRPLFVMRGIATVVPLELLENFRKNKPQTGNAKTEIQIGCGHIRK
jgi:hypothetical protein